MKLLTLILVLTVSATAAIAGNNKFTNPSNGFCPPGLAKKTPKCVPPGLAKKELYPGAFLPEGEYPWLFDPFGFGLPSLADGQGYVQIGDIFVKVDKETSEILNLFDALGQVLN